MARPLKPGLDYFPKDTSIFFDRKIRRLLSDFGFAGYVVYMYLLSLIYSDKGCYLIYDENLSFDVADILGNNLKENNVNDIVQGCIKLGLFDESLFKNSNILTSAGIQRRYVLAKRNAVIPETIRVIADETGINTDDTDNTDDVAKNVLNNPKSRVRAKTNKKVNKRNVFIPPTLDEVVGYFITEGFTEAAGRKAFKHYDLANWHDTNNKPVQNWKQKMNSVWFKPENLAPVQKAVYTGDETNKW